MAKRCVCVLTVLLMLVPGTSTLAVADESADRAAIETAAHDWIKAFNARDPDALLALASAHVVLLDASVPPVSGREAARRSWQRAVGAAQGKLTTSTKEIVVAGDIAWRIGALAHRLPNGEVNRGQSLEIWQRVPGGWKLHRQMSSTILVPPTPLTRPRSEPIYDQPQQ